MRKNETKIHSELSNVEKFFRGYVQHYNEKKYWKRYAKVTNPQCRIPRIVKYWYLLYLKRCDAFNNATMGAHIGEGIKLAGIPHFPHGLYGIIISNKSEIGENVTIFHQVTIGKGKGGSPIIGNNVTIGAGAKIFGKVKIGNNVLIGGGAVVTFDVPNNSIVRAAKGSIFSKDVK